MRAVRAAMSGWVGRGWSGRRPGGRICSSAVLDLDWQHHGIQAHFPGARGRAEAPDSPGTTATAPSAVSSVRATGDEVGLISRAGPVHRDSGGALSTDDDIVNGAHSEGRPVLRIRCRKVDFADVVEALYATKETAKATVAARVHRDLSARLVLNKIEAAVDGADTPGWVIWYADFVGDSRGSELRNASANR